MMRIPVLLLAVSCVPSLLADDEAPSIESLVEKLATKDPFEREAVAKALAARGDAVVPFALKALEAEDFETYSGAAGVLINLPKPPEEALPRLERELTGDNPSRARVAALVLEAYGPRAAKLVPKLLPHLKHENFNVRIAICRALAAVGPEAKTAVPRLLEMLREDVASGRGHAALALGGIGVVEGHDVVGALIEATKDRTALVRERAIAGLGRLGEAGKPALPRLRELVDVPLEVKSPAHQVEATMAIWRIDDDTDAAVRRLVALANDFERNLDAIDGLATIGPPAKAAVPKLVDHLDSKDPDVRLSTIHALGRIDPTDARAELTRLAETDEDEVVRAAARSVLTRDAETP